MIKVVKGKESVTSNLIINFVDTLGQWQAESDDLRHVEKEYLKYCKHYNKNNVNILGRTQYVPIDSWAIIMCDTIKNDKVEAYDKDYKYIVNCFVGEYADSPLDFKVLAKLFTDVREIAIELGATVAIPCIGMNCYNALYKIIYEVFSDKVDVELF